MARPVSRELIECNPDYSIYPTEVPNITVYYNTVKNWAAFFIGNRKNTKYYYSYVDAERMWISIDNFIKNTYDENLQKIEMVKNAEKLRAAVKVGDIFSTHWGYDQTNVDFFEVTGRKSRTRVTIREICSERVDQIPQYFSSHIKPIPGKFCSAEKIVSIDARGRLTRADEYGHKAYLVEDITKSHYISWGH